ncbi:MAG: chromophore lyase CpcT/CpeT [Cyanobacteriota bacterium SKYGB_h_bin112]|nr:chromophore lyase CpcT/CpeT [Cyanobacteriota bacterium SKYGB_h_bin112]
MADFTTSSNSELMGIVAVVSGVEWIMPDARVGSGLKLCFIGFALAGLLPTIDIRAHVHANEVQPSPLVQAVANRLVGVMDTSAQAARNPNFPAIRLVTCLVTVRDATANQTSVLYLYQEQGAIQRPGQPYRQRFLQLSPTLDGEAVRSLAYKPVQLATWVGFCDRPQADRVVTKADLGNPVCVVILKPVGNDYLGTTPVDGCPANYRGAVRITNRIRLHSDGMDTWDRGFDRNGNQVWGAETESYQFRWVR